MAEAFTVKTGATYAVTDVVVGEAHDESLEGFASGLHDRRYFRRFLSICDISFRTPASDLRSGMCGAMTHGDDVWRVRVTDVSPGIGILRVRGLALTSEREEWLDSPPSPEPSPVSPRVWTQFYDL